MPFLKKVFGAFCLVGSTTAIAAPQDEYFLEQGIELWGEFKTGMTKDEVASINLEKNFELVEDCRVQFNPRFRDDRLFSVVLMSRWTAAYNRCAELVLRSLNAKYGASFDISPKTDQFSTRGDYIEERWVTNKVIITLGYRGERLFFITYEPRLIREEADLIEGL